MRNISIVLFSLAIIFSSNPSDASQKILNKDGKPFLITHLVNSKGKQFASIYMTGKEMIIGDYGWPVSGAGYIEALQNGTYYIPFSWNGKLGGLHVKKIEWNNSGKTISISGLKPIFESSDGEIKISSDLTKLKIADGVLYLKLKDKGNKEYGFKIIFGKGVGINPAL